MTGRTPPPELIGEPLPTAAPRDWARLHGAAARIALLPERMSRAKAFVELLWEFVGGESPPDDPHSRGVSWVGFYLDDPEAPDEERLTLGPRLPGPACSPIGMHGACGRSLRTGRPLVICDVRELGGEYIACSPDDLSELVIPCQSPDGCPWGVLDLDSTKICNFSTRDALELVYLLSLAGLSA